MDPMPQIRHLAHSALLRPSSANKRSEPLTDHIHCSEQLTKKKEANLARLNLEVALVIRQTPKVWKEGVVRGFFL